MTGYSEHGGFQAGSFQGQGLVDPTEKKNTLITQMDELESLTDQILKELSVLKDRLSPVTVPQPESDQVAASDNKAYIPISTLGERMYSHTRGLLRIKHQVRDIHGSLDL